MAEGTLTETVRNPFVNTTDLPPNIRNFILLQNELKGLKGILIHAVSNPNKHELEEKSKKDMAAFWKRHLQEWMRDLLSNFYVFFDKSIDSLCALEDEIDKEIDAAKDTDPDLARDLMEIKNDVTALKKEAIQKKKSIVDAVDKDEPIDEAAFEVMGEEAEDHRTRTGNAASRFFARMKDAYSKRWGAKKATAAAGAAFGEAPHKPARAGARRSYTGAAGEGETEEVTGDGTTGKDDTDEGEVTFEAHQPN